MNGVQHQEQLAMVLAESLRRRRRDSMRAFWRGVVAGAGAMLAACMLVSAAHADIQIDSSGRTIGAPLLRSYLPNGTAHLQGLVLCDKATPERCVTVNADGSINANVTVSSVTVTSSALPTGAATSAKQPALGTAGTASTDVITVQGIASGVAQNVTVSSALPAGTNVIGHIICDSGCSSSSSPSFGAAFPATGTPIGFSDGTNLVAGRVRTGLIGASDNGIVVRPFMMSDGTNTMPAGDSSARSIHVTVDNGSATVTENSNLTLGTAAVAETVALGYGSVVLTPSTMTLGSNGTGMRQTVAAAGQQIMQLNAPRGDWRVGKANATGTSDTSLVAAAGSGVRFCMTDWAITNDSSTDSSLRFRDGTTDLTERIMVPNKGGNNKALLTPICTTANTAFQFQADTGVTTLRVTVGGYLTKE